ncbi:MAG: hypothetical protein AB7U23_13200 [Dehalococcoidia bacterium]
MAFGGATLIHWAWVTIAPIDVEGSPMDELAGTSTVRRVHRPAVRLKAQADEGLEWSQLRDGLSGADVDHQVTLTIRRGDADALGYTPRTGDRVLEVEERDGSTWPVNVYVQEAFRTGAWGGGASLWGLRLTDESPARVP